MEKKKDKKALFAGMISMTLFMIGDWLLDVKGNGNQEVGIFVNSNWTTKTNVSAHKTGYRFSCQIL